MQENIFEGDSIDKDISINEPIIQAQSYERNSMNYIDFRSLNRQNKNECNYDVNNISHSSSYLNEDEYNNPTKVHNKLDKVVEIYFSKKENDISRNNSTNRYSGYSDVIDNASSCGEPSLSRFVDNDALLKYESSRSKMTLNYSKYDKKKDNNYSTNINNNNHSVYKGRQTPSLSSSTVPSLSRYSVKDISTTIVSRNNRIYESGTDNTGNNNDCHVKRSNSNAQANINNSNSNNSKYKYHKIFSSINEEDDSHKNN